MAALRGGQLTAWDADVCEVQWRARKPDAHWGSRCHVVFLLMNISHMKTSWLVLSLWRQWMLGFSNELLWAWRWINMTEGRRYKLWVWKSKDKGIQLWIIGTAFWSSSVRGPAVQPTDTGNGYGVIWSDVALWESFTNVHPSCFFFF